MARETAGALALEGRLAEVQQLGAGALAAADADGRTTLHWAASGGHLETVQYLMAAGLEVNATDDAGWTPAHVAVSSGHAPVVRALLAGGADGLIANATGQLPLHYACSRNRLECAQLLFREGGAGVDAEEATLMLAAKDSSGSTPLMRACSRGHMQLTTWLIEAGANTTCTDHDGNTPLHLATIERDTSMVQLLLEHGGAAQLTAVNADGKTAYTIAAERAERMYGMPEHGQAKSLADLLNPPPELAEASPRQL